MINLTSYLSQFPDFENEKQVFMYLEEYLAEIFLIRPMLVFSMSETSKTIDLSKARTVLGKNDRLELYSIRLLETLLLTGSDPSQVYRLEKKDNCFYYYLSLGTKRGQIYFALFASMEEIPSDFLLALANFSKGHLKIIQKMEEMVKSLELIHIDDVTELFNQRKLFNDLNILSEKYKKDLDPFCILFIDIDHFKLVNDQYGHLIGTRLLAEVASDIKKLLRDLDLTYRYGGDEFVVILANSDALSGKIVGERILEKIKSRVFEFKLKEESKQINLSVSIGVAEFPKDARTSEEVLALADRMMYVAKEYGRGIVFNTNDIFKASIEKVIKG